MQLHPATALGVCVRLVNLQELSLYRSAGRIPTARVWAGRHEDGGGRPDVKADQADDQQRDASLVKRAMGDRRRRQWCKGLAQKIRTASKRTLP
jgi:hypothetical protein